MDKRIPPLKQGPGSTKSSALHNIKYIDPLRKWVGFEQDVRAVLSHQDWHRHTSIVAYSPSGPPGPHNIAHEQVYVGDETGLQGQFQQNVGQIMSAVFGLQHYDLAFVDFKCSGDSYQRIPDVVIMEAHGSIKAVGELKVPWVPEHHISLSVIPDRTADFRETIGQVTRYMKDFNVKYGFFSTYQQYVFLKQERVNGHWTLFYSAITQDTPTDCATSLTVRQSSFSWEWQGAKHSQKATQHRISCGGRMSPRVDGFSGCIVIHYSNPDVS